MRSPALKMALAMAFGAAAPILSAEDRPPAGPTPAETAPPQDHSAWGKEPIEVQSDARGQICLNGLWQFVPMRDKAKTGPAEGWVDIHVPGSWKETGTLPGLATGPGKGPAFKDWGNGSGVSSAYYQRKITIPREWSGRAILVYLDRVSTDAIVTANGENCGTISWPSGEADLSKAVKAGSEAELRIQVVASSDDAPATTYLDAGRAVTTPSRLSSKGLIGDVFLRSRPPGAHVSDVFVQTSTRKKELRLTVELAGVPASESVQLTARILGASGKEEKRFQGSAAVKAGTPSRLEIAWTWADPRLWDLEQPNLYTLRLKCQGSGWSDEVAQTFGFREFWVEGRRFLLNGTEIRLRPESQVYMETRFAGSVELTDAHIDGCLHAGFNIEECWPVNHDERGSVNFREQWAERADRKGFLLLGTALPINEGRWDKADYRELYRRKLDQDLRRYRNHPSIVIWSTNPNWLGNGLDQDPWHIGRSQEIPGAIEDFKTKRAAQAVAVIRDIDPTRPIINHAGANNGDFYNINCYLNFMPLQEREEWLSQWAQSGDMPIMCIEFGTPWNFSFLRGRWSFEGVTEPLLTEYCAMYLGREAYALEPADYREAIRRKYGGGQKFGDWINGETAIESSAAFQKMEAIFIRNTYRAWRTWGMTGGMLPWDYGFGWDAYGTERRRKHLPIQEQALHPFTPGMRGIVREKEAVTFCKPFQPEGMDLYPAGTALMEANGPTLAWISGSKASFTAKDHDFQAGRDMAKQVVLINDERAAREYSYSWSAELDGKRIAGESAKGRIDPAKTLFLPLGFHLPDLGGKAKAAGTIRLEATLGTKRHQDVFPFHVFAKPAAAGAGVALYDPAGKSRALLQALGCTVKDWSSRSGADVLVIGREALSGSGNRPLPFDLEALLGSGARVLILAQDPDWLRSSMGFRVCPYLSRKVFPVSAGHPVCQDLDETDLADWAGASTLVEAYPKTPVQDPRWRSPKYGFHWGNQGVVTSAAIEKPHRSGWRPILECEFDLAYSPLLELDYGQGRLTLCTLDLEDHALQDPAALVLAGNLLRYCAATRPVVRAKRTILLGDEQDRKVLAALGVRCETAADLDSTVDLALIGRQASPQEAKVRELLARGGRAFFLPRSKAEPGFGLKLAERTSFSGSPAVPAWQECQGLGVSDLHVRSAVPAWLLEAGAETGAEGLLGVWRQGSGVALFCQIDPDRLQVEEKQYFRITRWRETRAISQLLANLGATFKADPEAAHLARPQEGYYHPDYKSGDFKNSDDPYLYFRW
jgi:beta-galactosidase